jgi:anhydro-N-acetylmuramic acid kinase
MPREERDVSHNDNAMPKPYTLIGLMSGTSVDGVDACCVRFTPYPDATSPKGFRLQHQVLATYSHAMPQALRQRLLSLMQAPTVALPEVSALHVAVADCLADAVLGLLASHGIAPATIDAIASHGQTVYHQPPQGQHHGHTLQLGQPQVLAQRTGLKTLADFRPRDMAVGGHGAPLVCLADAWLLAHPTEVRCVQNIGGIANVTVLAPNHAPIAFDTGPGNMLMDAAMVHFYQQPYDADGLVAASGNVHRPLLQALLADPYFAMSPPKSTGRELFGVPRFQALLNNYPAVAPADWMATLTHFTVDSIATAYQRFIYPQHHVSTVIVGGGGGRNPTLMRWLATALAPAVVSAHEAFGMDSQYKEALAFALLGWATLNGLAGNLPTCTGASQGVVLGVVA